MEIIEHLHTSLLTKISANSTKTLQTQNWSSLLNKDPNMAYNNFLDEYSRIYNACFPLKAIKGKLCLTQFESTKNGLRTTWKLFNEVTNKRSRAPFPSSFESKGKTITDPEEIADTLLTLVPTSQVQYVTLTPLLVLLLVTLTFLLSPRNLPIRVNWKAIVACLPWGRPPAMMIFQCV